MDSLEKLLSDLLDRISQAAGRSDGSLPDFSEIEHKFRDRIVCEAEKSTTTGDYAAFAHCECGDPECFYIKTGYVFDSEEEAVSIAKLIVDDFVNKKNQEYRKLFGA